LESNSEERRLKKRIERKEKIKHEGHKGEKGKGEKPFLWFSQVPNEHRFYPRIYANFR
jgi:hypothetical protein